MKVCSCTRCLGWLQSSYRRDLITRAAPGQLGFDSVWCSGEDHQRLKASLETMWVSEC